MSAQDIGQHSSQGKRGRPIGYVQSPETRARISFGIRRRLADPAYREQLEQRFFKNATPEQMADLSALRSARAKQRWADPEWAERTRKAMRIKRGSKIWPPSRVDRLKSLCRNAGHSCQDIAETLNREFPGLKALTKKAVWSMMRMLEINPGRFRHTAPAGQPLVPHWVPQDLRDIYAGIARRRGEHKAAELVRAEKRRREAEAAQ